MKALVAYMSKTGNTRKIAEAIYEELDCEKEIKTLDSVNDSSAYDIAFYGFPIHQFGPDKKAKEFLEKNCTKGKKVALFITHAAQEDAPELPEWLGKFKVAASSADIVGFFNCQGQLAKGAKFIMYIAPSLRAMAKRDDSKDQPDATRVARAREFANETMARCLSGSGS
jgi:flavodoxin